MRRYWFLAVCLTLATSANGQLTRKNLSTILGFENGTPGNYPAGWGGGPVGTIFTDDQVVLAGKYSARLERTATSSSTFSTLTAAIPLDFAGKTITWSGYVKTEGVVGSVGVWIREDGATSGLQFASSQGLNVSGTTDWKQYTVTVPVDSLATTVVFGFLLSGTGKAWVDNLSMQVDGIDVSAAPNRVATPFDTDHEFDAGSKITMSGLSDIQIQNLAKLARIWGFLKYHHPAVTGGKHHWDYELFRILPGVLSATDSDGANQAISDWIAKQGAVAPCSPCATFASTDLQLNTNLDWLSDESLLGHDLSQTLQSIYANRTPAAKTFYVSLVPNALNPQFDNELTYPTIRFPDSGYQLLALFRFWNMVQYFYPNRDIIADDPSTAATYWDDVLTNAIPAIGLAKSATAYQLELMKFIGAIHDTHANLWSSIGVRPPTGACYLPVDVRFVEGRAVVLRQNSIAANPASGLNPGDIIEQLDGVSVSDLVDQWTPYYADSNGAARMRDIAQYMTRGACGSANVLVTRGTDQVSVMTNRVSPATLDFSRTSIHDLPGPAFQMLTPDVAYIKISTALSAQAANYIRSAAATKGLIIDIRDYPSDFPIFALGGLLVSDPMPFVIFTNADVTNPGVFYWTSPFTMTPLQPHYSGKVVILVDETTQSSAEYHALAFRQAPGALLIGSTTAGADGNVSTVPLPGNLSSYISGLGVFYPDRTGTQRVGIVPDIYVTPTIEGIRAGRDELIEEAMRQITGDTSARRPKKR